MCAPIIKTLFKYVWPDPHNILYMYILYIYIRHSYLVLV